MIRTATHIETVTPQDRLNGYGPPSEPSAAKDLAADLQYAQETAPSLGCAVWKVKRPDPWQPQPRRLILPNGKYLKCAVIGGTGPWWFVRVSTADGLRALSR